WSGNMMSGLKECVSKTRVTCTRSGGCWVSGFFACHWDFCWPARS
ncbi:hypothetical protein, partial [Pseudomonas fluorescens]